TPEGRSIVVLARDKFDIAHSALPADATIIPFTAQTRVSGVRIGEDTILKGAVDSILKARAQPFAPSDVEGRAPGAGVSTSLDPNG
ncbi:hypothetical protein ABTH94_21070, partial [Acinetobacter baumannii]